jgi:type II secretory pathway pseudopilin PulG
VRPNLRRRRVAHGDRGDTLLELVIAVAIMGVAMVAVLGAVVTAVVMSDTHRKQATAGAYARDYAEAIQTTVAGGGYVACAGPSAYATPAGFSVPTGYTASIVSGSIAYWNGTAWQATCTTDSGLQRLTTQVRSDDDRAVEHLVVVLRKPCRVDQTLCG